MNNKWKPNFLGIGAAKAGTTSLANNLSCHPEINFPRNSQKELHFFDELFQKQSKEWYFKQFDQNKAVGEFTPSYLYVPECRDRIYKTLGQNLKFIVALRNPVDRAYSHYCHAVNTWNDPKYRQLNYPIEEMEFLEAVASESLRLASGRFHIRHLSYFSKGLYARQLKWYFKQFPRENFYIYLLEKYAEDPESILKEICKFIAVDPEFNFVHPQQKANSQANQDLDPRIKKELFTRYLPSIIELEELLDLDLSQWKTEGFQESGNFRVTKNSDLALELKNPIFIVGSPRSGTTLLQCMLNVSKTTFSLPETHYFCTILSELGLKSNDSISSENIQKIICLLHEKMDFEFPEDQIEKIMELAASNQLSTRDLFIRLVNSYRPDTDLEKIVRLIEKTPYHVFYLQDILELFPEAKFIHLVRDPRDVVSSRLNMPTASHQSEKIYAQDWSRSVKSANDFYTRNPDKLFTLRYEDLVEQPGIFLERICSFLDVTYQAEMQTDFSSQYQTCTIAEKETWKKEVKTGQIHNKSGIWKQRITPELAQEITAITKDEMRALGYSTSEDKIMTQQENNSPQEIHQIKKLMNKRLSKFKNKHAGERCVIIGNGPSLNKMDLSLLKDEITFGLNRIYLGFDGWDFRPDYFVSVNSLVLEQHAEEILEHIQAPKFISYHGLPYFPTDRDDVIFLQSLDEPIFSRQPSQGVWEGYTVTYVAMQMAYYLGFSEVILIGVDHSFVDQGPANTEVVSKGEDQNHFAKDYFGKGARWHLPDLHNSEMAYRLANFVYRSDNRQILDATVNGKLTVFPKVNYQEHLGHQNLPGSEMRKTDPEYLISAIVSTYNDADLLSGCLDDLEKQTIADQLEIIVVDSGSEENEAEIVREYQQRYENIVYLRTERESLYDAWNRGIFLARGKYITNANTDDGHRTDALELLVKALEKNPQANLAYAHCSWTSQPNDSFEDSHGYRDVYYPAYNPEKAMFYCLLGPHPVWRKDVFEKIGMFDNRFRAAGDFDFQFRFVAAEQEAILVPEILSLFYQNPRGLTLEDQTSDQEAGKIYQKYRSTIPISSLYRINPKSRDDTAAAWTALGNRAVRFTPPWEDLPQQDLSYASACYQRALQSQPQFYPAFHNLITILGGMGKWEQARDVLQQGAFYEAHELEKAVQQQQLLPLETVKVPIKSSMLEYCPVADISPAQQKKIHNKPIKAPFGFNVIGYLSGRIGLGFTARNVLQALQERGFPVQGFDLELKDGRGGADLSTLDIPIIKDPAKLHYGINLYVVPPPTLEWLHDEITRYQRGENRLKVAWSMWELPVIPEEWVPALETMDLLIAESDFIRYAFDFNLSGVRSITAPHPLFLPEGILADREHFNLPEQGVLFLTGFEPLSDPRRKNPRGAVSAFLNALGEEKNAHLIIKLNHGIQDGQTHPLVQPLVDQCAAHPRIHILNQSLTYKEVLSLYKSCDVIVSLHRSEGLGLVPMEAMRLEKPVLATAWSGNMSYMNYTNSCPVSYRLIQANGSLPQYRQESLGPGAVWADPDLDDAAKWMWRLFTDSKLREKIGIKGKKDLEDYQQRASRARFLDEIQALWEHRSSGVKYPIQTSSLNHKRSKDAEKTFQEILEADDLQDALEKNRDRLDYAVLDLVEETILDARSSGHDELAQGLENLAAYISEAIA